MFDGPTTAAWSASLALRVRETGGRARMTSVHRGPLLVQKALYPEGADVCHAVLLHPPGGIAGGDALNLAVDVGPGAHALVTTPGAARWYKANGRLASQAVHLDVGGALEWLPQEAIVYDAADVRSSIDIDVHGGGGIIGWDIVALGRQAAGERFQRGLFVQTLRLRIDGALAWTERTRIPGGDGLLASPIGLAGRHVFGCLWAAGPEFDDATVERLCAQPDGEAQAAALTRLTPRLLVARTLGGSTEAVRGALTRAWEALRPVVFARPAVAPRLWAT